MAAKKRRKTKKEQRLDAIEPLEVVVERQRSVITPHVAGLCDFVSRGGTLVDYCRGHGLSVSTVEGFLQRTPEAKEVYARAREAQGDALAAQMLQLADDCTEEDVQSTRTKIDTRKWLLSRWHRKTYGDHQKVEHEGGVSITVVTGVPQSRSLSRPAEGEGLEPR